MRYFAEPTCNTTRVIANLVCVFLLPCCYPSLCVALSSPPPPAPLEHDPSFYLSSAGFCSCTVCSAFWLAPGILLKNNIIHKIEQAQAKRWTASRALANAPLQCIFEFLSDLCNNLCTSKYCLKPIYCCRLLQPLNLTKCYIDNQVLKIIIVRNHLLYRQRMVAANCCSR